LLNRTSLLIAFKVLALVVRLASFFKDLFDDV